MPMKQTAAGKAAVPNASETQGAEHPFHLPVSVTGLAFERVIFVTPLCAARMKRRSAIESLLMAAGAHEDV